MNRLQRTGYLQRRKLREQRNGAGLKSEWDATTASRSLCACGCVRVYVWWSSSCLKIHCVPSVNMWLMPVETGGGAGRGAEAAVVSRHNGGGGTVLYKCTVYLFYICMKTHVNSVNESQRHFLLGCCCFCCRITSSLWVVWLVHFLSTRCEGGRIQSAGWTHMPRLHDLVWPLPYKHFPESFRIFAY